MRLTQYDQTQLALGGDVTLSLVTEYTAKEVDRLFVIIWRYIYQFERAFSRFIPMSELSLFNRSAGLRTAVTPAFRDLLSAAKMMGEKTDGLYNPFILPALQRAGYKKSAVPGYEQDAVDDHSRRQVVSVDKLQIGDDWASIPHNTALDMGGCGKGYLADKLGQLLSDNGITKYRLSLGGDIITAGTNEAGQPWRVGIQDASNLSGEVEWTIQCPVEPFAIATSGTFRRRGQTTDRDWHHIIDPLTLKPARTDIRLATICASTALEADVLASCAVILGSQKTALFFKKHAIAALLLQGQNEKDIFEIQAGRYIVKESMDKGSPHA